MKRVLLIACLCHGAIFTANGHAQEVVRVGVVAFEDLENESRRWSQIFGFWQRELDMPVEFALGTHSDVLHWMANEWLDLAVLPAGAVAYHRAAEIGEYEYLATLNYAPASTEFAEPDRRAPGHHLFSRPICVVKSASDISTERDLIEAVEAGCPLLFVHPASASGSLTPRFAIANSVDRKPLDNPLQYTYSHTESLRLLAEGDDDYVAFVFDDALAKAPELSDKLRRVAFRTLDGLEIPNEALLVRTGFRKTEQLRELLATADPSDSGFLAHPSGGKAYDEVDEWLDAAGVSEANLQTKHLSLEEIGWLLLHASRTQPKKPRLAIVFSGGGAKCSYQVGAIGALEEKLAELRSQYPAHSESLDVQLVVGTSGGAINALPVALGVSKTEEGRKNFQRIWMTIDQRDIIRPPTTPRLLMGLWFGLCQFVVLLWLARRLIRDSQRRGLVFPTALMLLGLSQIALFYVFQHWSPWRMLGDNHVWHHLWMICSFGIRESSGVLVVLGGAILAVQVLRGLRHQPRIELPDQLTKALTCILVVIPVFGFVHLLLFQETLSDGKGVEGRITQGFSELITGGNTVRPPSNAGSSQNPDSIRLQELSRQILDDEMLERDLVLTGTCLRQQLGEASRELPADLYFYAKRTPDSPTPPFGEHGVSIHDHPNLLLDVILGSGSIFPIFPPRTLRDFPVPGSQVELVDGGFAHNSPIEAAVQWGATHVIVIEATPERRVGHRNLTGNIAEAFSHLHRQTQQVDLRSKKSVAVYTLGPRPPHLCVLDFADNLIEASIQRGYDDARGRSADPQATARWFVEDLGRPDFVRAESGG